MLSKRIFIPCVTTASLIHEPNRDLVGAPVLQHSILMNDDRRYEAMAEDVHTERQAHAGRSSTHGRIARRVVENRPTYASYDDGCVLAPFKAALAFTVVPSRVAAPRQLARGSSAPPPRRVTLHAFQACSFTPWLIWHQTHVLETLFYCWLFYIL